MPVWLENPSPVLSEVFEQIHQTRMRDLPILNPVLKVEAIGFHLHTDGHWLGVMITPWAINLLRLPGHSVAAETPWPSLPAGEKHLWQFGSGPYEFTVAELNELGDYHLCSLFSPALEFPDHTQARLTAKAVLAALPGEASPPQAPEMTSRRAFLGLKGKRA